MLGPGAKQQQHCQLGIAGYDEVINFIVALNACLITETVHHNLLAHSKLGFIVSFTPCPKELLTFERKAHQRITN